jgi:hypothetical protein
MFSIKQNDDQLTDGPNVMVILWESLYPELMHAKAYVMVILWESLYPELMHAKAYVMVTPMGVALP